MNRKEAAEKLMQFGIEKGFDKKDKPYDLLVKEGLAGERPIATWHSSRFEYFATAATSLALLDQPCLKRAKKLAREPQLLCLTKVENFRNYDALVEAGLAFKVLLNGCVPAWKPTDKLIAAVECWREANAGNQTVAPANENTMGDKTDDRGFLQIGDCSIRLANHDDLEICTRFGKKMRICGGDFESILNAMSNLQQVTE